MSQSLYKINETHIELMNRVIDQEGIIDEATAEALAINEKEIQEKGLSYGFIIKTLEHQKAAAKAEKERIAKLEKTYDNTIKRMKEALLNAMQLHEITKIEGETLKIGLRKSTKVVQEFAEFDPNELPDELKTVKTTVAPNLKEIGNKLKAGQDVEGFRLQEGQNINIR